jgi:hypothetical protein
MFTPAEECHGLWPWMNALAFGRDLAPHGRELGATPIFIGVMLHLPEMGVYLREITLISYVRPSSRRDGYVILISVERERDRS